jgi:AcrR family transcriptional regulator
MVSSHSVHKQVKERAVNRIAEPQNERSRRTRAAVLNATWQLLEEAGGPAVTMSEVARRAGVSRRALYLHFSSRSDLIGALHGYVDEVLDLESSLGPVREAPGAVAALDELAAHLARYHPQILAINRAVVHGRRADADLADLFDKGVQAWLSGCVALARALADEGRLAEPWTVQTAADMLLALMRDEVIETLAVERGWSEEQMRDGLRTIFRRTFVSG